MVTVMAGLVYAKLNVRRPTVLLALPGFLLMIIPILYDLTTTEFEWSGRQYRWAAPADVEVLDTSESSRDT